MGEAKEIHAVKSQLRNRAIEGGPGAGSRSVSLTRAAVMAASNLSQPSDHFRSGPIFRGVRQLCPQKASAVKEATEAQVTTR